MNQNPQEIEEHLLLNYLNGDAGPELTDRIAAWLEADSRNGETLDRLESLWREAGRISPPPLAVDTDAAWARMVRKMDEKDTPVVSGNMRFTRLAWAVAASILLLAGLMAILFLRKEPAEMRYSSAGQILKGILPDSSTVILNSGAELRYPESFKTDRRTVKLTGEALFSVVHKENQPFVVEAGDASVRVLGTTFSVKVSGEGDVLVSVSSGKVLLFTIVPGTGDTAGVELNTGEAGRLVSGGRVPEKQELMSPDRFFWADRSLDFRGTMLSEVFSLIERCYGIKIVVREPSILYCRLTASFKDEQADHILEVIAESFGLTLSYEGGVYTLSGHGCAK